MTARHARPETPVEAAPVRFVDVLRIRTFGVLFAAELQSILGDQVARVALSILVYERTGSAGATGLTYALTFLPTMVGGFVLSGLADRFSRRTVMIVIDTARAGAFAAMAIPSIPTAVLFLLLFAAVLLEPIFQAAEVSTIAEALDHDQYRAATAMRMISGQAAQVAGFALGGVVVAALSARWALVLDAATFVVSACVVSLLPIARSLAASGRHHEPDDESAFSMRTAFRALTAGPVGGPMFVLAMLVGFFVVPEALAAPFAATLGSGERGVGLLLAAMPFGAAIGAVAVTRLIPDRLRLAAVGPMAALAGIPLIACAAHPHPGAALVVLALSGLFTAYQVEVLTTLVHRVPEAIRGRAVGILGGALTAAQGIGLAASGWVADRTSAGATIAGSGAIGSVCALVVTVVLLGRPARRSTYALATEAADGRERVHVAPISGHDAA